MSKFIESLKENGVTPEIEQFIALLEIPDIIFDQAYGQMKTQILNELEKEEFKTSLVQIVESGEAVQTIAQFQEILEDICSSPEELDLSENKVDFLKTIFGAMIEQLELAIQKPYIPVQIQLELCHEDAKVPTYANMGDAGMDIYAVEDTEVAAGATVLIKTGLKVAIPFGYELQVRPRSGMSLKTGIRIANAPGTIDCGYRNEIGVIAHNTSTEDYAVKKGDRVAQLVLQKVPVAEFVVVNSVSEIGEDRGGGFGSSGK